MSEAAAVEQLRLAFPGGQSLLFRDLNLTVHSGEKVLLLGPSGCGKSTLLQVLTGLIPNSIEMPIKVERQVIPQSWGFVFQDPDTQFCMPYVDDELAFVLENLQVPREQMASRIAALLSQVGLRLDSEHTPIQELSQGMKQRLAIACVIALEPEVWFVDEPTALLDEAGTKQIWDTLKAAAVGKTLIIVEHKIDEIADYVDRVVVFDSQAAIVADGPRDVIFAEMRSRLTSEGIWIPGIWDDYIQSNRFGQLMLDREARGVPSPETELLTLRDWTVLRGKQEKLHVQEALVGPGEWISIIGENGAGKSTLLLAMLQLLRTTGYYSLLGQQVTRQSNSPARELALVFQNPEYQFVTNSVQAEIAYTLQIAAMDQKEIEQHVEQSLEEFELTERKHNHPYQLSMGQKRRLSVAAAAVKHHRALLLDEPTFGQDARNTFAILERLERHRQGGTTILMVTHDPHIVANFSTRVWTIRNGRLDQDRTVTAYKELLNKQDAGGPM
ncbi:MAG: transporter related protein [Paenibacillus sp.]|nr:transporter related protein [Paenibacillus sp.]